MGHVITTAGGSGPSKQVIRYLTERVVGNGSFGVVFQAKCIETGETVSAAARCLRAAACWQQQGTLAGQLECCRSWQSSAAHAWGCCSGGIGGWRLSS